MAEKFCRFLRRYRLSTTIISFAKEARMFLSNVNNRIYIYLKGNLWRNKSFNYSVDASHLIDYAGT